VRVKLRHIPPNLVTASSLILALLAVMMARERDFDLAAWMILWCVVLDKVDGTVARLLKAGSEFGVEFDSVADFCAFGIAPGFFTYEMLVHHPALGGFYSDPLHLGLLRAAVCFFVLAVGARLARFNVDTPVMGDRYFVGIPTTLVGALLASFYLTCTKYDLSTDLLKYYPAYLAAAAVLMVSTLRLPKLIKRPSRLVNVFQLANFGAVVVCGAMRVLPEYLFGLAASYLVVGVTWTRVAGVTRRTPRPSG
jgi:CDP-diacylglycerol--serine O-phosphatidyltransferase